MRLPVYQCFHCAKTDNVHKTRFYHDVMRLSVFNVVFDETAFKRKEMLVLALFSVVLHTSKRLHISHFSHCVKTNNVHKTRFSREITRFSTINAVFAEKRV